VTSAAAGVLSLGAGLTAKKPSAQATGSQTEFSADPDAGNPILFGRTGTAGNIIMRRGWDTNDKGDNDRQAFVTVLSLGPIAAIEGMTVDRSPIGFTPTGAAIGAFAGFMWSMAQLGAVPEASALSFGAGAGTPPGWSAAHKLSGKAATTWTLRFDTNAKLYQNGVPAPMWVARGQLCYDPTKDSTYPGGSGPHRMADPADTAAYDAAMDTWEWSDDPYLLGLRWAHGLWQRDRSDPTSTYQRVAGLGAPWPMIDVPAFVEGRNIAKANGWAAGGVAYTGDGKWDTLKKLLQAGMGEPLALGARISCLVNAPKVSLATIGIDDVVGQASVSATQPRRDRINTITPRYRLEENNWQLLPGAPISVAKHVAEDKGKRSKAQDYAFIQNSKQVGTAVRYDIENAREFGPIVLPLKLVWMGYRPGDCVTVQLPELGLNGQDVLLLNRNIGAGSGIVTMTARSETADKHPFALGQTSEPPPTPGVTGAPIVPVPGENAWAISATSLISEQRTVPALVVTGASDARTVDAIVVEYRIFANGQGVDAGWVTAGLLPANATRGEIVSVRSGTAYEVSVAYRRQGVTSARRILGPVVTAGEALDYGVITGPTRPDDNATNSADPESPFGPDGKVKEAIAKLDRIEPIEAEFGPIKSDIRALKDVRLEHDDALAQLADVTADQGAAQRQITRDVGRMDEALLRALMESARTREVLRDAGIVVDPATGQVRIYAIDQLRDRTSTAEIAIDAVKSVVSTKASVNQVQQLIAQAVLDPSQVAELEPIIARLTSAESEIDGLNAAVALKASLVEVTAIGGRTSDVEQTLDALAGEVSSKASTTAVDQLGIRVGSAEQMLSALPDVSGYSVTVRQARVSADDAAEAALRGMLAGDIASRYQLSQIAEARQELTTKLVDAFTAEATARTALTVQIGQIRASVLSEAQASVTRDSLLTQRIDAQGGVLDSQAAAIGEARKVALDAQGGVASAQMTIRQQIGAADSSDEALLRALIAGDEADRARIAQAVQIQTEFTTTLVENERAAAVARQSLLARMNAAEAAIISTSKVAADANQATAQRVNALEVAFNDAATGLIATRARIVALEEATAAANAAFAQQLELIEAAVGGQGDGLAAISATVALDRQARVDGDAANALAVEQVRTQVNDPQTGLPATAAGLAQERTARTQGDAANAQEIQAISAALYDPQTGLPATRAIVASDRQARIDGDSANASAIQQARAIIDGVGGVGVEQAFSAVATRLGKVEGRYTVIIDANGNLSGFQLIGSDAGPASFNLINTDLRMGTGRVIFNNGTYMQVQGVAFGANGDLLEWFGPTMAITSCTRANAISYKTITGDAYFGGSLSAGVLKNAVTSSLTTANASLELGPFGTTGKPKSVVASYSYSLRRRVNPPGGSITGTPSATLVLERRRGNDGTWVQLQTGTITGETSYDAPEGNTPGLGTQTMAGAITITDNSEGAQDFSYRLTLVSRTLATFNFSSPNDGPAGEPMQSLSLVSVEQ
jgi:hypothetical protein